MAKNDKGKPRLGTTPNTINPNNEKQSDEWKDEEAEAEVRSSDAQTQSSIKAQTETRAEVETYKEGFFEKAKHVIQHALHLDEPQHLSHASQPLHPEDEARVREAHKVDLGEDGAELKGLPINKVPGKLRKFVSQ